MTKDLFPRGKFNCIVLECIAILARHGFRPMNVQPSHTEHLSAIFEEETFTRWFGDVEPKSLQVRVMPKRPTGPTQQQLDMMTLECALVYIKYGVSGVPYNESLNGIRATIAHVLTAMGYERVDHLCISARPGWGCYKLWEDVARQGGFPEEEIAGIRGAHERKPAYEH